MKDTIIQQGLTFVAGLDKTSEKQVRTEIEKLIGQDYEIDFNTDKAIEDVRVLADAFKEAFNLAGINIDWEGILSKGAQKAFDEMKNLVQSQFADVMKNISASANITPHMTIDTSELNKEKQALEDELKMLNKRKELLKIGKHLGNAEEANTADYKKEYGIDKNAKVFHAYQFKSLNRDNIIQEITEAQTAVEKIRDNIQQALSSGNKMKLPQIYQAIEALQKLYEMRESLQSKDIEYRNIAKTYLNANRIAEITTFDDDSKYLDLQDVITSLVEHKTAGLSALEATISDNELRLQELNNKLAQIESQANKTVASLNEVNDALKSSTRRNKSGSIKQSEINQAEDAISGNINTDKNHNVGVYYQAYEDAKNGDFVDRYKALLNFLSAYEQYVDNLSEGEKVSNKVVSTYGERFKELSQYADVARESLQLFVNTANNIQPTRTRTKTMSNNGMDIGNGTNDDAEPKLQEQNTLVERYNQNKAKTLELLKKEQLSYDEILYLLKEYQSEYYKSFYSDKNLDLGDEAVGLSTSIYNKLRRGDMIDSRLDRAINGVGVSTEDAAQILADYQNVQAGNIPQIENETEAHVQNTDAINKEIEAQERLNDSLKAHFVAATQQQIDVINGATDAKESMRLVGASGVLSSVQGNDYAIDVKTMVEQLIANLKENIIMSLHDHPNAVDAFTPADIESFAKLYYKQGIKVNGIIANGVIKTIDFTGISQDIAIKIGQSFSDNLSRVANESKLFTMDHGNILLSSEIQSLAQSDPDKYRDIVDGIIEAVNVALDTAFSQNGLESTVKTFTRSAIPQLSQYLLDIQNEAENAITPIEKLKNLISFMKPNQTFDWSQYADILKQFEGGNIDALDAINQINTKLKEQGSLIQNNNEVSEQLKNVSQDEDEAEILQKENGTLEERLELLRDIADQYGDTITQKHRDRYEALNQKEMDSGLTTKEEERYWELSEQIDAADQSLQEFSETYDKIILKLANGKTVEILPNDKGLRDLYKFNDEYGETFGGIEIDDIQFVRAQKEEIANITQEQLETERLVAEEARLKAEEEARLANERVKAEHQITEEQIKQANVNNRDFYHGSKFPLQGVTYNSSAGKGQHNAGNGLYVTPDIEQAAKHGTNIVSVKPELDKVFIFTEEFISDIDALYQAMGKVRPANADWNTIKRDLHIAMQIADNPQKFTDSMLSMGYKGFYAKGYGYADPNVEQMVVYDQQYLKNLTTKPYKAIVNGADIQNPAEEARLAAERAESERKIAEEKERQIKLAEEARVRAEEEARLATEKAESERIAREEAEKRAKVAEEKEVGKSLLPNPDNFNRTDTPTDDQKAEMQRLIAEYIQIAKLLRDGDKLDNEFIVALKERANAILDIVDKTRMPDGLYAGQLENYGVSVKNQEQFLKARQGAFNGGVRYSSVDTNSVDNATRQKVIDLLNQEIEAAQKLAEEEERTEQARKEASRQKLKNNFIEAYKKATEEERKLAKDLYDLSLKRYAEQDYNNRKALNKELYAKSNFLSLTNEDLADYADDAGKLPTEMGIAEAITQIDTETESLRRNTDAQKQNNEEKEKVPEIQPNTLLQSEVPLTGTAPSDTSSEQAKMIALREAVATVTTAVEAKTQAFRDEETAISTIVDNEIAKLNLFEEKLQAIQGIINNIAAGKEIGEGLSNITVNVNNPEPQQEDAAQPWALESTLSNVIKPVLDQIQTNTMTSETTLNDEAINKLAEVIGKISVKEGNNGYKDAPMLTGINNTVQAKQQAAETDAQKNAEQQSLAREKEALSLLKEEYNLRAEITRLKQQGVTDEELSLKVARMSALVYRREGIENDMSDEELTRYASRAIDIQNVGENKLSTAEIRANIKARQEEIKVIEEEERKVENQKQIEQKQREIQIVKELVVLYKQLGEAQASGDTDEASRLRGEINSKRGNLSSIDYATDMKFKAAKESGFDAEKVRQENKALEEQETKAETLTKLWIELGKQKAIMENAPQGAQYDKAESDYNATLAKIVELGQSTKLTTQEEIEIQDKAYAEQQRILENEQKIKDEKKASADATKAQNDAERERESQLKKIASLEKEIGQLQATKDVATDDEVRYALEQEIQFRQHLINLQKQGITLDAEQEAYLRKKLSLDTSGTKKTINAENREAVRLSKAQAGINKSSSVLKKGQNILTGISTEDFSDEVIAKIEDYKTKLTELNNTYNDIKSSKDIVSDENKQKLIEQTQVVANLTPEIKELVDEYQRLSGANATVIGDDTLGKGAGLDAIKQQLTDVVMASTQGKASIKNFNYETGELTYQVKTGAHEFTTYTAAVRHADGAIVALASSTKKEETFLEAVHRKTKEISRYLAGSMSIMRVISEVKRGITYVKEIDSALVELKKVTDETEETYDRFLKTASKTASIIGSTVKDVVQASAEFARLGYSIDQSHEMAQAAIVYTNVGDGIASVTEASESLISTLKAFGMQASESMSIVDKFNEVGNNFSITSKGIGDALQRSASALQAAGNSLDESIGLITAANSVVQDPESVGK